MSDQEDRELVRRCLALDRRAWERFVDKYGGFIHATIIQALHSAGVQPRPEDVDDLFADVFLQIVDRNFGMLRTFEWRSSLKTLLWVVTRKRVGRHFRKKRLKTRSLGTTPDAAAGCGSPAPAEPPSGDSVIDEIQTGEFREIVREAMEQLPERDRLILSMYFFDELSYKEMAAVLGVSAASLGPLIHRAKSRLEGIFKVRGYSF